jgi:flagellar hook capping protein FlgD
MRNNSRSSRPADVRLRVCKASHWTVMPVTRMVSVMTGLTLMPLVQGTLRAQTFVQLAELNPNSPIGSRITSTVTRAKLGGRTLFGWIGSKVTYVWAPDNATQPTPYEFATDEAWNRVLFGRQHIYIHGYSQVDASTSLQGPARIDFAPDLVQWLTVAIADRGNERIVYAQLDTGQRTLATSGWTPADADLSGVTAVACELSRCGGIYALSVTGRVSYWTAREFMQEPATQKVWAYGGPGTSTGQFRAPKGICIGRAAGSDGAGSGYTRDFYIADGGNHRLVWFQRTSTGPTWMGAVALPNGGVPLDCTVDHFGNVTVADSLNSRLIKYTWNLGYLDTYGSYGVGASNNNTLAHPHAVHVPCGIKGGPFTGWLRFCDGRVITAEDWGTASGAREHYFGTNGSITVQPNSSAQFSYFITDHGSQRVNVVNAGGTPVRTLVNDALDPPGTRTVSWDGNTDQGTLAPTGNYSFSVVATSAYGCTGQSWCTKTLPTGTFFHQGPPVASISGPSGVQENTTGTWTGAASAGVPPYSYRWTVDGGFAGTGTSVTAGGWAGGSTHTIGLTVTDALAHSGSTSRVVRVTFSGGCLEPPCPQ